MKNIVLLLLFLFGFSYNHYGRANVSDSYSPDSTVVVEAPKPIRIVDINFEIERTRKTLLKMSYDLKPTAQFAELDSLLIIQKAFMVKEAGEFKQFNPYNLSKYFLENTYRAWSTYNIKLQNWMDLVNDRVALAQVNLDELAYTRRV